jgi:hypothetical protein
VNWADEEATLEQLTDSHRESKVPLWNDTFNISFRHFRYRIAQIAQLNHLRVEAARRASWDEIPDGALVIPVDDDDWFAPSAARVLERELDPRATGYLWDGQWIEVPIDLRHRLYLLRRRLIPATPPKWICATNNYALIKDHGAKELLNSHLGASRAFTQRLTSADGSVKRIDARLSVANRTLASQTMLGLEKSAISRSRLIRKFHRYQRLYERPVPAELDWCSPYLKMMCELMAELKVKEPR